jgi:hypothetical protein
MVQLKFTYVQEKHSDIKSSATSIHSILASFSHFLQVYTVHFWVQMRLEERRDMTV